MKVVQVINWGLLVIFGVTALSWGAVCLMVIPYPSLVEQTGVNMTRIYTRTAVFTVLTVLAIMATWLSMRRHALVWAGQAALLVSIVAVLGWWLFT